MDETNETPSPAPVVVKRPAKHNDRPAHIIPPVAARIERKALLVFGGVKDIALSATSHEAADKFAKMVQRVLEAHLAAVAACVAVQTRAIFRGQAEKGGLMLNLHLKGLADSMKAMDALINQMDGAKVVAATPEEVAALKPSDVQGEMEVPK